MYRLRDRLFVKNEGNKKVLPTKTASLLILPRIMLQWPGGFF
jgi:hypothetical protein